MPVKFTGLGDCSQCFGSPILLLLLLTQSQQPWQSLWGASLGVLRHEQKIHMGDTGLKCSKTAPFSCFASIQAFFGYLASFF